MCIRDRLLADQIQLEGNRLPVEMLRRVMGELFNANGSLAMIAFPLPTNARIVAFTAGCWVSCNVAPTTGALELREISDLEKGWKVVHTLEFRNLPVT